MRGGRGRAALLGCRGHRVVRRPGVRPRHRTRRCRRDRGGDCPAAAAGRGHAKSTRRRRAASASIRGRGRPLPQPSGSSTDPPGRPPPGQPPRPTCRPHGSRAPARPPAGPPRRRRPGRSRGRRRRPAAPALWGRAAAPATPRSPGRSTRRPARTRPGTAASTWPAPPATPVLAAGDGVVVRSPGMVAGRPVVSIDHAGGLRTTYEPVEPVGRRRAGGGPRLPASARWSPVTPGAPSRPACTGGCAAARSTWTRCRCCGRRGSGCCRGTDRTGRRPLPSGRALATEADPATRVLHPGDGRSGDARSGARSGRHRIAGRRRRCPRCRSRRR